MAAIFQGREEESPQEIKGLNYRRIQADPVPASRRNHSPTPVTLEAIGKIDRLPHSIH
ncbi:hypothetical protein KSP40_PGU014576 [Platanthera guangdongensis]|uniref:Uncharacterized protein n=1 Tax=Platanthera guangdongensis TaxID=2320717 RepID=A0ABR2MFR3_9ASPA